MEAGKTLYYVFVTTEKGVTFNVTNAVQDLGWEENEKELSMRVSFTLFNAIYNGSRLSSFIKIGQPVTIKANWGAGPKTITTAYIKECERDTSKSAETYKVTAYDCLFNMQKSNDDIYYAKGKKTKKILTAIFKKWGIEIDKYTGPNVKHGRIVYKNKSLADVVLGVLNDAAKKGGAKSHVRASGNKVSILANGSNANVYYLNSTNCIESKYKISIVDMVTKVKITAVSKKNKKRTKVKAVVKKNTQYGVIQKIQTYSKGDSKKDAKKAAKKVLNEHGSPKKTMTVQAPDIPDLYKGDKILIKAGSLNGYYLVKSIQHNAASGKMSMEVKAF